MNEIASLIYWNPDLSLEEIQSIIERLRNGGSIQSETTKEYNPDWGSPVWYIP